jgi:hypothetical protein
MELNSVVGTPIHHFRAMELGHGGFFGERLMVIPQPTGLIKEKACTFNLKGHVRQFKGIHLKCGDGFAELHSLFTVFNG